MLVSERNEPLLGKIRLLKSEHPFWGYRRIWAHLRYVDGMMVNQKRILRIMREAQLLVKPNLSIKASRVMKPKPKPTRPNEWWGIDMTKVMTLHGGWVYIVVVLDWRTKKVVGHYAGYQSKSWHWLLAVDKAVNRQFPALGARGQGVHLMSDNGCQPTSESFMKTCRTLGIQQAFTSYNNPKGNADTERMMRTLKEELFWLREWNNLDEIDRALDRWVEHYNSNYLHSALGYQSPECFEREFYVGQDTPLNYA